MPLYRNHQHFVDVCLYIKYKYSIEGLDVGSLARLKTDLLQKNTILQRKIKNLKEIQKHGYWNFIHDTLKDYDEFIEYHNYNCEGGCEFCENQIPNM